MCSKYVRSLSADSRLFYSLKSGTLAYPEDPRTPMIVVGPGTGIAPFISFLEERETELAKLEKPEKMSRFRNIVFFGCRNKDKDFLFHEYLQGLQSKER